jgi:hypothetical protein
MLLAMKQHGVKALGDTKGSVPLGSLLQSRQQSLSSTEGAGRESEGFPLFSDEFSLTPRGPPAVK